MSGSVTCPGCGSQYIASATVCADCGAPLQGIPLPPDGEDEVGYELDDWLPEQRAQLTAILVDEAIPHRWEGAEVVVREQDADVVEDRIDELDNPDALAVEEDDDDGGAALLSALYVAADVLRNDPGNAVAALELAEAAEQAAELGPPYGVDGQLWREVQERAGDVAEAMAGGAESEDVAAAADRLRTVVRPLV